MFVSIENRITSFLTHFQSLMKVVIKTHEYFLPIYSFIKSRFHSLEEGQSYPWLTFEYRVNTGTETDSETERPSLPPC